MPSVRKASLQAGGRTCRFVETLPSLEIQSEPSEILRVWALPFSSLLALQGREGEKAPLCGNQAPALTRVFVS